LTKNVLEHYQNPDPVGLPEAIVPPYSDPEPIPDNETPLWSMHNSTMRGHSKFRLKKLYVNLVDLQVCTTKNYLTNINFTVIILYYILFYS